MDSNNIPEIKEVVLTTNATLLGTRVKELKAAGLKRLNISLDTLRPEVFEQITGKNQLAQTIEGIEKSIEVGFETIKLNVVLMRGMNDDELESFVEFAMEKKLTLRFIELMRVGAARRLYDRLYMPAREVIERLKERYSLEPIDESFTGTAKNFLLTAPGCSIKIGVINGGQGKLCPHCSRLRLTSEGNLRRCLMDHRQLNLKDLLRAGADAEEIFTAVTEFVWNKKIPKQLKTKDMMYAIGG